METYKVKEEVEVKCERKEKNVGRSPVSPVCMTELSEFWGACGIVHVKLHIKAYM